MAINLRTGKFLCRKPSTVTVEELKGSISLIGKLLGQLLVVHFKNLDFGPQRNVNKKAISERKSERVQLKVYKKPHSGHSTGTCSRQFKAEGKMKLNTK